MRSLVQVLAGSVALAVMLIGSPLAAQDATEQPAATAAAPQAVDTQGKEAVVPAKADTDMQPAAKELVAVGSDAVAAPSGIVELAPPPPPPPPITLVLNTDLGSQRLTVIENGKAKYTWPISSGRRGFATPTGTFHPQWASKMHYSRQYEFAPMPHAVFFHRGTAFHGTGAVGLLGQPASHGCVRLAPGNAAQLFNLVHKHGYASTKVVVHSGSRSKEPAVARRGSRGELASARPTQRGNYRVSRASTRRSSYSAD
jgi:lipoprotein-anchoring transpeptidase ErfK/SrfK